MWRSSTSSTEIADQSALARNPGWKLGETQKALTGYIGVVVIIFCATVLVALHDWGESSHSIIWDCRKLLIVCLVFAAMAFVEIAVFKTPQRNFDFTKKRTIDGDGKRRLRETLVGFYACITIAGGVFAITGIWFPQFLVLFYFFCPILALVAPIYFIVVAKFIKDDSVDELQIFGNWLTRLVTRGSSTEMDMSAAERKEHLANLLRGLVIKGFFIPFMTISCIHWWTMWERTAHAALQGNLFAPLATIESARTLHLTFISLIHLIVIVDVTIALLGYLTSSRLLDTQFTSAEPTPLGWFSALVCYPPFNYYFESIAKVFTYNLCWPIPMFQEHPVLSICASVAIVGSEAVYSWATVVFGLRFSNLTNRGIICSGPYRWVRHPAYLGKNVAFWLSFLSAYIMLGDVVMVPGVVLLVLGMTYVIRALTEERHLMREKHYQEYCARVPWRFIPGIW